MAEGSGRIDLARMESALETRVLGRAAEWPNELFDEVDSTSSRAAVLAAEGAPEGVVVLARRQTAGRGRQAKRWESPADAGIYMSVVLRPQLSAGDLPLVSLAAGVAAAETIERCLGLAVGLKWVNDLIVSDRKVAGILAELQSTASSVVPGSKHGTIQAPAVVLGIGINLNIPADAVPDDLKERIGSLEPLAGRKVDGSLLAADLLGSLESSYEDLRRGAKELVISAWKQRSVTLGRQVLASTPRGDIRGTASDITDSGALVVTLESGEQVVLTGGEVSIRLADGRYV